jgi:hypothetical protein
VGQNSFKSICSLKVSILLKKNFVYVSLTM